MIIRKTAVIFLIFVIKIIIMNLFTYSTHFTSKETTETTLKWGYIAISNAKRPLLVNYHKIKGKHLQLY